MAKFQTFDRVVSFQPGSLDTKWIESQLAVTAKDALVTAQRAGEASKVYIRSVNGRIGVPEEAVIAPGDIVYTFSWMREAAMRARELLILHSPVRSGKYRRSFIAVGDGRQMTPMSVQNERVVELVNTQPYSRKIQVGAKGFAEYRGLFDLVARRLRSEYPAVLRVRVKFVRLSAGYALKRTVGARRSRRAGAEMNYPAIELVNQSTAGFN